MICMADVVAVVVVVFVDCCWSNRFCFFLVSCFYLVILVMKLSLFLLSLLYSLMLLLLIFLLCLHLQLLFKLLLLFMLMLSHEHMCCNSKILQPSPKLELFKYFMQRLLFTIFLLVMLLVDVVIIIGENLNVFQ